MSSTRTDRPSTLHDVAAVVGVSPRTVSRVVNDEGGFSDATRARVLDAVEALNYRPNVMARGLITRRTSTIALVTPVISDPFFPEVADGVQKAARKLGLTMFFASTDNSLEQQAAVLNSLDAHAVDGVIVFPSQETARDLGSFAERGMKLVVVDADVRSDDLSEAALGNIGSVSSDLADGARQAVEHLVDSGRRNIGMIANVGSAPSRRWREDGFRAAAAAAGINAHVVRAEATADGGRLGIQELLARVPQLDGMFAYNDVMAIGAMRELDRLECVVPDDVAVVGCDDIQMSEMVTPSLTTVQIDRDRLGREALRVLVAVCDGESNVEPVVVPVRLVERDST